MSESASSPQALSGNGEFGRMSSRRLTEENPGCSCNRGFSLVALIKGPPNSEGHPAMIGAGCPVLPLETGARCLFHGLSPARVSLSSLRCGFFISAATVTAASVIAASVAARNPAAGSAVRPTAAINKVSASRGDSTIATGNESTAGA